METPFSHHKSMGKFLNAQSDHLIQIVDMDSYLMANSADPDPTDLDLHCLQRQDISGFSRTRVKLFP